jgi:phage tail protein X
MTPADKRTHAAQEELRNLLAELQQVAENAIASSVDSTLKAAMIEAASTIDDLHWGKRPPRSSAPVVSATISATVSTTPDADCIVSAAEVPVNIPVRRLADSAAVEASPRHNSVNAAQHNFYAAALHSQLALRISAPWKKSSRWTYVGISTIVLLASVFAMFIAHLPHLLAAKPRAAEPTAYQAEPRSYSNAASLSVVVQPNQTVEALSAQYVGHFDYEVLQEIRALNPGLADPGHLEPGKTLKLPLIRGVRNNVRNGVPKK